MLSTCHTKLKAMGCEFSEMRQGGEWNMRGEKVLHQAGWNNPKNFDRMTYDVIHRSSKFYTVLNLKGITIDVDVKAGKSGRDNLYVFLECAPLPKYIVSTKSGGFHLYYTLDESVDQSDLEKLKSSWKPLNVDLQFGTKFCTYGPTKFVGTQNAESVAELCDVIDTYHEEGEYVMAETTADGMISNDVLALLKNTKNKDLMRNWLTHPEMAWSESTARDDDLTKWIAFGNELGVSADTIIKIGRRKLELFPDATNEGANPKPTFDVLCDKVDRLWKKERIKMLHLPSANKKSYAETEQESYGIILGEKFEGTKAECVNACVDIFYTSGVRCATTANSVKFVNVTDTPIFWKGMMSPWTLNFQSSLHKDALATSIADSFIWIEAGKVRKTFIHEILVAIMSNQDFRIDGVGAVVGEYGHIYKGHNSTIINTFQNMDEVLEDVNPNNDLADVFAYLSNHLFGSDPEMLADMNAYAKAIVFDMDNKPSIAPLLIGGQNIGKTTYATIIGWATGWQRHGKLNFMQATPEIISERFSTLGYNRFVIMDEGAQSKYEGRVTSSRLKLIITSDTLRIEEKGAMPIIVPNRTGFMICANYDHNLNISDDVRRTLVADLSEVPSLPYDANVASIMIKLRSQYGEREKSEWLKSAIKGLRNYIATFESRILTVARSTRKKIELRAESLDQISNIFMDTLLEISQGTLPAHTSPLQCKHILAKALGKTSITAVAKEWGLVKRNLKAAGMIKLTQISCNKHDVMAVAPAIDPMTGRVVDVKLVKESCSSDDARIMKWVQFLYKAAPSSKPVDDHRDWIASIS